MHHLLSVLDAGFCTGKSDGYYEDIYDCTKFYHCTFHITYHQDCSPGTVWDQSILTCNFVKPCVQVCR